MQVICNTPLNQKTLDRAVSPATGTCRRDPPALGSIG